MVKEAPVPEPDAVLKLLIGLSLTVAEADFRGILESVAEEPQAPKVRDLVISTVCVLMSLGKVSWPVTLKAMNSLKNRSDEQLKEDAVAIVNGSHLVVPYEDAVQFYDVGTMRQVAEPPSSFVSTIYSCTSVWDRTVAILSDS